MRDVNILLMLLELIKRRERMDLRGPPGRRTRGRGSLNGPEPQHLSLSSSGVPLAPWRVVHCFMAEKRWNSGAKQCRVGGLAILSVWALLVAGCREPLITENQQRSPFQQYDRVRNQDPDPFVLDEFGRRRPNLTDRLSPR